MDPNRFDDLARVADALRSRRGLVGGALAALLAVAHPSLARETEAGKARRRKRRRRRRDRRGPVGAAKQPLGGLCKSDADCDGRAACVPGSTGLRHCKPAGNPDSCLGLSEACRSDGECCGRLACLANDGFVSCQMRPTEPGEACGQDAECGAGATCGEAVCECDAGFKKCDDRCVDTRNDASFCGTCGTACNEGEVCRDGRCRCGENDGCENGEVCLDGLCALGGGGSGELPLYGWGGNPCSFSTRYAPYCLISAYERKLFFGAIARYREGEECRIDASVQGNCRYCFDVFGANVSCRPQVTPTAAQIRQFDCEDVAAIDPPQTKVVDCVTDDCRQDGKFLQYDAGKDLWVCRS